MIKELTPFAKKLFDKIVSRNESHIVTVDDLIETVDYSRSIDIINAIQELKKQEMVITQTATNHGRFETEIIPLGGIVHHKGGSSKKKSIISRKKR